MFVAKSNASSLGFVGRKVILVADTKQEAVVAVHARQICNRATDQSKIGIQLNKINESSKTFLTFTFSLVHSVFNKASRLPVLGTYEVSRVAFKPRANWLLISMTVPKIPSVFHFSVRVKPKQMNRAVQCKSYHAVGLCT